jgi:hypothetical protein
VNIYVVLEGELGSKKVYSHWIPLANPGLTLVRRIDDVTMNNFYVEAGGGFPFIFEIIEGAIENVATIRNNSNRIFDRLVVALDSEEATFQEKYQEINEYVQSLILHFDPTIDFRLIIQHFCFEAWALGNRRLVKGNIHNQQLLKYRKLFDVGTKDPELLPPNQAEGVNRAQFADKFLRLFFNEKFRNLTYSKNEPTPLCHDGYFNQLKKRLNDTGHIPSFTGFLTAFV